MIITNRSGLPEPFVEFAQSNYKYKDKQYSVTSICQGLKKTILHRRHIDEIEVDVQDTINRIFGTAVHKILEEASKKDYQLTEKYLRQDIIDGYKLSGRLDLYDFLKKTIYDYKTASTWKVKFEDYSDFRKQLLIYSWLMQKQGYEVEKAEAVLLLKDYSKNKAKRDNEYPNLPIKKVKFTWVKQDFEEIEKYIKTQFKKIIEYEQLSDNEIPPCSKENRWADNDSWAVYKKGNKRAYRVLDTEEEAQQWMKNNKGNQIIYREGTDTKCEDFCSVNKWCNYYQKKYGDNNESL